MNKITISAPGKLMLFGEHAVVYDRPCIVTAVGQRMKAIVELTDDSNFVLDAPDVKVDNYKKSISDLGKGDIPKGAKFVEIAVLNFLKKYPFKGGLKVTTRSEFNSQFGFGSSSASTVCVIKALSELLMNDLSYKRSLKANLKKEIFELAFKTVLDIQGKGSGFDVAAAVFGGTLYFVIGGKVIKPLKIAHLPLIVGYTGIKFDTVKLIDEVAKKAKKYPWVVDNVYDQIGKLVEEAKKALLKGDLATLGELMNFNEGYLATLGVEGKKLADMIYAAREAGAYGAKLSGAGIGDCMIAIAPPSKIKAVKEAITKSGGQIIDVDYNSRSAQIIDVKTNVDGVRVEK